MASPATIVIPRKYRWIALVLGYGFITWFGLVAGASIATRNGYPSWLGALAGAVALNAAVLAVKGLLWLASSENYTGESTDDALIITGRRRITGRSFIAFRADIAGARFLDEAPEEAGWNTEDEHDKTYPKLGLWDADPELTWGLRGLEVGNTDAGLVGRLRQSRFRPNRLLTAAVAAELEHLAAIGRLTTNLTFDDWQNTSISNTPELGAYLVSKGIDPNYSIRGKRLSIDWG